MSKDKKVAMLRNTEPAVDPDLSQNSAGVSVHRSGSSGELSESGRRVSIVGCFSSRSHSGFSS
jgi:hypothetical protein